MIISASWKSLTGGDNLRGVSIVLALAAFLKGKQMPLRFCVYVVWITFIEYSHWSKDIVFVISDSHLDGMHAWLTAYHEPSNTGTSSELFKVSILTAV